jgi:SAM-dependent methyltransferase
MGNRQAFDLFLISWLVLFLELACIRWFPSHVLFLTFFTNTVLLASFVGMSIGCLVARRPGRLLNLTPYALALAIAAGLMTDYYSYYLSDVFQVGNQANPDEVFFGTEHSGQKATRFTIPIEVVGGLFFVLIAVVLVGPGQEMGRAFNRVSNRTTAYSANLLGSLVGIGMFAACSYLRLPPVVWFGASVAVLAYLLVRPDPDAALSAGPSGQPKSQLLPLTCLVIASVLTVFTSGFFPGVGAGETTWSPYYRIDYYPTVQHVVTNKISHQVIEPRDEATVAPYALPYLFQRDLRKDGAPVWSEFKRILIIGAGSGNDVSRALRWASPDTKIDAVEIDPVIQSIGVAKHPDHPFADPRVTVHLNDGRNFLRTVEPGTYDLVIFALIDSLVLQSGYSNLRLESYLFTQDSFEDVRRALKPSGVFAVYNFFRQGWIAARIREQLRAAFDGTDPVVMTAPPSEHIAIDQFKPYGFTMFFSGSPGVIDPLRNAFKDPEMRYWYPWWTGVDTNTEAGFGAKKPSQAPPASEHPYLKDERDPNTGEYVIDPATGKARRKAVAPEWIGMRIAAVESLKGEPLASDDWPFLYTRRHEIPDLTWRGVVLTLLLSLGVWLAFGGPKALAGDRSAAPEWGLMVRCFFLGAGFMLVETKAVVQMALLFGGTWMVNTAVFAAILIMSLIGNLYAGKVNPKRLEPYYLGLFIALGIGLAISPKAFLGYNPTVQIVGACLLVFAPIAFAGVIFATSFKRTSQPDRVFGANVAGALFGGLSENFSVLLGFQLLLGVAVVYYLLSALLGNRSVLTRAAEDGV